MRHELFLQGLKLYCISEDVFVEIMTLKGSFKHYQNSYVKDRKHYSTPDNVHIAG